VGLSIASSAPNLFTRLLGGSVTLIFFTYAFVNMAMVSGLLPVVGVPLPFISYGGTALTTPGLGAGILTEYQPPSSLSTNLVSFGVGMWSIVR
jgi:rod shape determining protein RodA